MTINRDTFFQKVNAALFKGGLTPVQKQNMSAVVDEWEKRGLTDLRWLAYMFATIYHETAKTMRPIEEFGKGQNRPYGRKLKMGGESYTTPDKIYYGRGFVQLTWYENYELLGKLLHVNLLEQPELALDLTVATQILFEGMIRGIFTGKGLAKYLNEQTDWFNARRIINGVDKAQMIVDYALLFAEAWAMPADVKPTVITITKTVSVAQNDTLKLREQPGTQFKVLEELLPGTSVSVGEEQNGWCRVNDKGWVNKKFLV